MPTQLDDAQRSTTGSTTSSEGDAQARLEELGFYRDAMETVKKGLTNFEARQGKKPVQWWL